MKVRQPNARRVRPGSAIGFLFSIAASLVVIGTVGCRRDQGGADTAPSAGADGGSGHAAVGGSGAGAAAAGAGSGGAAAGAAATGGSAGREPLPGEENCEHPAVSASCSGEFCRIPAGCFIKGSPVSEFGHSARSENQAVVTLTRAFEILSHEVTRGEWAALMPAVVPSAGASGITSCTESSCPVDDVTFYDALEYTNRLSERAGFARCYTLVNCTGEPGAGRTCESVTLTTDSLPACTGYRLPTDAEHEYATRAGTTTAFYAGEGLTHPDALNCYDEPALAAIGWYCRNFEGTTHPAKQKAANAFGLYDMVGNVAEYVNDPWTGRSEAGPLTDPAPFDGSASLSTVRGGQGQSSQRACRSAAHLDFARSARGPGVGFRVVRTLPR